MVPFKVPYYIKDPKGGHNFDNYPSTLGHKKSLGKVPGPPALSPRHGDLVELEAGAPGMFEQSRASGSNQLRFCRVSYVLTHMYL